MKKVLFVFGTRPEAIKMCPLVLECQKNAALQTVVCVTGQHKEMLTQVLDVFGVTPDYNLDIMRPQQTLSMITERVLAGMEEVLAQVKPDVVLVHGDTTTSMAAALAAFYARIPVGHVEAGLRTYNKYSPYPEEMNRTVISRIADLHFAPTDNNRLALEAEGVKNGIYVTGNTVIDAFRYTIRSPYTFAAPELNHIDFSKRVILLTAHRRENLGRPLENICQAVTALCRANPDVLFVYPVHKNPAVRRIVEPALSGNGQVLLLDPVDVVDMHNLMNRCFMVMTDSGGLQEEAPHLGKPVLVLRTETERPEAVQAGTVAVVGVEKDAIVNSGQRLLSDPAAYEAMSRAVNPYGDGFACQRIAGVLAGATE